jgi:hypothetical protein
MVDSVAGALKGRRTATAQELSVACHLDLKSVHGTMRRLVHSGQAMYDLTCGAYRWRQVMSQALGEEQLGSLHPELVGARDLLAQREAQVKSCQKLDTGGHLLAGRVAAHETEMLVDADGRIRRGKCICGHYQKYGMRNGPCRHMLVLRWLASSGEWNLPPLWRRLTN